MVGYPKVTGRSLTNKLERDSKLVSLYTQLQENIFFCAKYSTDACNCYEQSGLPFWFNCRVGFVLTLEVDKH